MPRYDKAKKILELARVLAASAEGLTLDEMCGVAGRGRRTVERMRDTIRDVFPQMQELPDHPTKRFRIPRGLDSFFQDPTAEELSDLGIVIAELTSAQADGRARSLKELDRKIRAAMRHERRFAMATDVEALLRAERIVVEPGPRPAEDPEMLLTLRQAILRMKLLGFVYHGGSRPGAVREVAPFGIIFGRTNYLIGADAGTTRPKHWRLDRIENLEILAEPAPPPPDFDLAAFANTPFAYFEGPQEDVVLRVLPEGTAEFRNFRFHPSQTVENDDDGGATVRFRASGMLELAWHLFTWGDKIEIVAPETLRRQMREELQKALAHHGGAATADGYDDGRSPSTHRDQERPDPPALAEENVPGPHRRAGRHRLHRDAATAERLP